MSEDNKEETGHQLKYFSKPTNYIPIKKIPALSGILTFTILAILIALVAYQRFLINKDDIKKETYSFLTATKEKLQESLAQGISATKSLSFFIQRDGAVKDFDSLASQILAINTSVDVLQLAPGGIIRNVYPLKGNEKVLGYDILNDPARKKEALIAIQKKAIFFAGPLALKQGGMGVVGRLPIFANGKFWGFSAVVIKLPTLLKASGIDSLGKSGYYFQLSKINPDTHLEEFFITHPQKIVPENFVSVTMPTGDWKLSAIPVNLNKGYGDILLLGVLGFLFSVLGGVFVFTLTKKPQRLERLIQLRTAALQESEENYRSLIEQASDAVIVYSYDGVIHQFNKAACTETGYTQEEFAQLNLQDLLLEKKVNISQLRVDQLESGKNAHFERKLYKKDGSIMEVEINANLLSHGKILAFVRNITERRKTEDALKESEEKFSKAFQSNLLAFAIYDAHEKLVDLNEAYAVLLGTKREDVMGENPGNTKLCNKVSLPMRNTVNETIINALATKGRLNNYETQIETNDGEVRHLLLSLEPLELNNQQHWLCTVIDITEKKNAEISLLQSEIKYRSLIEQASDGIVISNWSGIILEVNNSICKMGGYDITEMTGRHIDNFLPTSDIAGQPLRIDDLLQGKTLRYERRLLKKDGTALDVEVNSKMGIGNTLVGFVRDITNRKEAETELIKSKERYELIEKATNDAVWDHNFITDNIAGNENYYDLYGFIRGKDKIDFKLFESRLHPDEHDRIIKKMQRAISEKSVFIKEEFRFKQANGSYTHFYNRAYIKYDDNGIPVRMVGVMQDITGRIKGEQNLLKEKELSDSIINSLPAVFYILDKKGQFLRWNKTLEIVSGYSGEEISFMHTAEFFDEADIIILEEKLKEVYVAGRGTVVASLLTKHQQKIPYYFSGMRIEYEGEICLMGFGFDFTDKVQSERLLKESEQKFRSLVEQASDGVVILSQQGNPLYISPSVERMMGYTEAEMMQLNIFALTHPDDVEQAKKVLVQVLENPGLPIKGHTPKILHKDGGWRWLETTVTNMLHIPAINGIVLNFRNVTEKLLIEKKILTEKEWSDSIINSLPGIFYVYDYTGRYIRWNKNFEIVTGYSPEEIRQMHPLDFYGEDQKLLVKQRMKNVLRGKVPDAEFILLTKDGKKIPFFYNSKAIEYEGVPSIVGMAFDITERKKIEQELWISNQHLEHKATELEVSYTELERFAYIVSHDLQEPLRMVSSFLKLLQQKYKAQLDETADKYIHFAVDGAERMKQLIMDLLEYSRTGTNKEMGENTNMIEVMADVMKVLENTIQEQNAVVQTGNLPVLRGTSKIQLFQLMQNLVSNALKYHSQKSPVIKIDVKEEPGQWVFSIQDNGIGIDPKYFEKIFIIFQRLHSKTEFSGTGIGLSICKKIVEKHGGKIWLQSSVGNGSTFYFSIPQK